MQQSRMQINQGHCAANSENLSNPEENWSLQKRTGMTVAIPLMASVISLRNRLLLSARSRQTVPCGILTAWRVIATVADWRQRALKRH
jgi:hypothetical protein